jgi:hypothetical protein
MIAMLLVFRPFRGYVVDSDFQYDAGFLIYGFELTFKFAVIPNLALGGNVGSRFSYKSGGVEIPKISEELSQTVVSSISPIEFLISYEILRTATSIRFWAWAWAPTGSTWFTWPIRFPMRWTSASPTCRSGSRALSSALRRPSASISVWRKMGLFFDIRYHYLTKLRSSAPSPP